MANVKSASKGVKSASKSANRRNREQIFRFTSLDGGLNLRDAEINLQDNESPEMVNLWRSDGVLQSRPGQQIAASGWRDASDTSGGNPDGGNSGDGDASGTVHAFPDGETVYAAATLPDGIVTHIGAAFYTWQGDSSSLLRAPADDIPRNPGTFFRFGDTLYYKNVGGFYRLTYDAAQSPPLTLSNVADAAFVPTITVNAEPATGQGDAYQSANRLSPYKRVLYRASATSESVTRTGNGLARAFSVGVTASERLRAVSAVYVNNTLLRPALYSVDTRTGTVVFNAAPDEDAVLTFTLELGDNVYCLPETGLSAITEVKADGLTMEAGRDYAVDLGGGVVTFAQAPAESVAITYRKADNTAFQTLMNCPYAAACGNYLLMGGATGNASTGGAASGNASTGGNASGESVHYSGLTESGPDISYWPMDANVFVGEPVTGFGTQYDQTIVFQPDKIGKLTPSVKTVNGYDRLTLSYSVLNDKYGCNLPRSIRLIGNNLLFANTSGGVYQIRSASAARENNVRCLSGKVNGSDTRPGLLYDMRIAGNGPVCSFDDSQRYWLAVNGHVWLWDYAASDADNPVWYYFTGLSPQAFALRGGVAYLIDGDAQIVRLGETYNDFGQPIRKVYQFPVRNFGGYDLLKDVRSVILSLRADTPSDVSVIYETDYETRTDLVSLTVAGYDRLTERNLETRDLSVPRHAAVFRRKPKCKHVRHFSLRLENNTAGQNLAPYSAEIGIRYEGRLR